ncbi:MAG: heavy metal translocating P-type ATPase [Hyphomicrobiaceae bacterium]
MSETTARSSASTDSRFAFKVSGMDCPSCAAKVETAVTRLEGISDVCVNFSNQVLTFRADNGQPNGDAAVEAAVRKLGYGVESLNGPAVIGPSEEKFRVTGMDCPTCADKVATALARIPGISEVGVNFGTQILSCTLDPAKVQPDAVEKSVKALGYHVELLTTGDRQPARAGEPAEQSAPAEQSWWETPKGRLLVLLSALTAAGAFLSWSGLMAEQWSLLPAALVGLGYFGRRAIAAARAGTPFSIEMLVSLATAGAILIGASSEAAIVNILFLVGELLEGLAASRARAGIRSLVKLIPRTATLIDGEVRREVPVERLELAQVVLVRPGDRIPVDGEIIEGTSGIDESAVTGESMPVNKSIGAQVFAGSVNTSGTVKVRTTRRVEDNTISRIIHLVEEAQATKAPTARFIDRFSQVYTPLAVLGAALVMIVPPLLFGGDWATWIYRGLAVLLIACPCALVLSTPAAIASALAAGTRRGLLIKGGAALETMGHVRTVAFDKTGTLTVGKPVVTDIMAISGSEDHVLAVAAAVESGSTHPIARAIVERAVKNGVKVPEASDIQAVAGKAMTGRVEARQVLVGSPRHAAELGHVPESHPTIECLEQDGKTVVVVVEDGQPAGFIAVRDEPRPDARLAVARLNALGIHTVMLTGDNRRTGAAVAKSLGLDVRAELLPDQKLTEIARLKTEGPVAMVGDGINDAPALAAADVGIAMGGGTDVALETADAGLLHERVSGVAEMIVLSRRTLANIRQNVAIALGLKAVFLVTTLIGITGLWPAIMADTGATVLVTLNALRLLGFSVSTVAPVAVSAEAIR